MVAAEKIWDAAGVAESHSSEIPSSSITIDHSLALPDMKPFIVELCKDLFKQWSDLEESRFSLERVSGGITNLLLKVSVREKNDNVVSITVRLYGPNTEYVINRERELQAIPYLSAAGFGAKLLGVFGNGMVQSFINARTLTPSDMRQPKLVAEIAKQLRKFHEVEIPGSREPQLWNDIFKFFDRASSLKFDDIEKQKKYDEVSFEEIKKELSELKVLTDRFNAPIVYSHNDLLSGNLMIDDAEDKLYFIDFEYGSYNYRGFDIGNHFNEYAGYECDYSMYPSKDEQYYFFRHYLRPEKPDEVCDEDLEAIYVETNAYMLASHLYWALWALIQEKMSPIDFDYLGYFFLRYNEYKRQKDKCFSMAQANLHVHLSPTEVIFPPTSRHRRPPHHLILTSHNLYLSLLPAAATDARDIKKHFLHLVPLHLVVAAAAFGKPQPQLRFKSQTAFHDLFFRRR
ncbi:Probable ethanolamine kinase [Striga hermonthica]|uniref:ethanolamine kinase n=1 Tax=Striga hermonthica TaxID=68872 RepID=A0A9N7MRM4_STRHE|nr:Probable ethanolamine kinase [Striga hermonthica]